MARIDAADAALTAAVEAAPALRQGLRAATDKRLALVEKDAIRHAAREGIINSGTAARILAAIDARLEAAEGHQT